MIPPSRFLSSVGPLALFAVLAVALTWPLGAHPTRHVPAGDNDLWQNYWNFWWWRTAIESGQSAYRTNLIYQPGEVSLAFHTHSEANILLAWPVLTVFGPAAAINTAIIIGFALAGWGGYLLARELVGDRRAALLGGAVLAFSPHHFEQSLEHLNLASYQGIPFFLLFLVRLARRGGLANALLTGGAFAWSALLAWHNGLLVLPLAAVLFARELRVARRPRGRMLLEASGAGLLAAAMLLPFLWPMAAEIASGATYYIKPAMNKAIDPVFLLVPAENHPLWGSLFAGLYERFRPYPSAGFTCYLGLAALGTWIAGSRMRPGAETARDRPEGGGFSPLLWAVLLGVHVLLAMGDSLLVLGWDTGVPLPFALLRDVPLLGTIRLPNRFLVPALIPLAMLTAHGASRLLRGGRRWTFAAAACLISLDLLWVPYPTQPIERPPWIDALARAPAGILLDLPGGHRARGAEDMYLQTLHRRPIAGGYASCVPPWMEERVKELPLLQLFFEGRPAAAGIDIEKGLADVLARLPIAVIAVHLDREREALERLAAQHRGSPRARLFNPEKGTARAAIESLRRAARGLWGEPFYTDATVELFARR